MEKAYGSFISIIVHITLFIYEGIKNIYNLMLYIAESEIVSEKMVSSFTSRIYILLGIFMLFKLSFSLVTYVINPDEFFDKTKGITSIIKNVIISLVLLVLTPYLFQEAKVLQTNMLNEHIIENLVFGNSKNSYSTMNESGKKMQFLLFAQWVRPNVEVSSLVDCDNIYVFNSDGTYQTDTKTDPDTKITYVVYKLNDKCTKELEDEYKKTDAGAYSDYINGLETQNLAWFHNENIFTTKSKTDKKYLIKFNSLFAIVSGIIVIFILISFCFDIAVRTIKLGFFQIMAPIPIISLCDPKGKDGIFKKWLTAVINTYLSLFIKLASLYFSINIISQVLVDPKWHKIESVTDGFATAFIIIGALMFAKQLPNIITEITGIKFDSKLQLNPFKKIEDEALGGKKITSGMGAVGAMGVAFAANTAAGLAKGKGFGKLAAPLSGLRGAMDAGFKGLGNTLRGEGLGKSFSSSYKGAMDARKMRSDMRDAGVKWYEPIIGNIEHGLGMYSAGDKVEAAKKKNDEMKNVYQSMLSAAQGNDKQNFTVDANGYYNLSNADDRAIYNRLHAAGLTSRSFEGIKDLQLYIDEIKKTQIDRSSFTGLTAEQDYARAVSEHEQMIKDLEDVRDRRLNRLADGTEHTQSASTDNAITEGYSKMLQLGKEINGINEEFGIATIELDRSVTTAKRLFGEAKGSSYEYSTSQKAEHATRVNQFIKTDKK